MFRVLGSSFPPKKGLFRRAQSRKNMVQAGLPWMGWCQKVHVLRTDQCWAMDYLQPKVVPQAAELAIKAFVSILLFCCAELRN